MDKSDNQLSIVPATPEPETTTTRNLTITIKVNNTSDIDSIVTTLKEYGDVTGVNYYEQTYNNSLAEGNYIY